MDIRNGIAAVSTDLGDEAFQDALGAWEIALHRIIEDCRIVAPDNTPQAEQVVQHSIIAGALFDFLGFLTTRDNNTTFGANSLAAPAVDLLSQWAEIRSLPLDEADVNCWQSHIGTAPPAPDVSGLVEALERIVSIYEAGENFRHIPMDEAATDALAAHQNREG